jgi:phosphoribosylaminoimidazolecarboxamide formyltransferase/IMP cyclohydrolase
MKKLALLSVSDRTGLCDLASALVKAGYTLLATSGTGKELTEQKLPYVSVEDYTGLAELLDGRVKTLHPKIHSGILARRDDEKHLAQLKAEAIDHIDVVVVNLYPFLSYVNSERASDPLQMTELVDVGGPTMIRAAAKNHRFVLPLIDPADYPEIIKQLEVAEKGDAFPLQLRQRLAAKVFSTLSHYDGVIGRYFASVSGSASNEAGQATFEPAVSLSLAKETDLRYGENPHQKAALYKVQSGNLELYQGPQWTQHSGKELSYNNMLDLDAALRLVGDLPNDRTVVAILKHLNPCGIAYGPTVTEAIQRAKQCDPRSHFGGVMVINRQVDKEAAEEIRGDFAELVIAPSFEPAALEVLKTSKNLRIISFSPAAAAGFDVRTVAGGILVQQPDSNRAAVAHVDLVSERVPTDDELSDLNLAWRIVGHVKSNAIVIVRDGLLVGVGAGQMSRIDSVELAITKATVHGHLLHGAVAASDAFFPFPDSVETLAQKGITCVVAPSGAKRDEETIAAARKAGVSLFFAQDRHFRH